MRGISRTTLAIVIIAVVVIAAVAGFLVWRYYFATPPKKMVFVVIGKSVHPYWSVVEAGVKKAGQELGVEAIFWVPSKEDVPAQLSTMDTYIAQNVAGIAIAPSDPSAATPYINKALEKGIPVITIDTDAAQSNRLAYLGTGNYRAGWLAGLLAWQCLKEKGYAKPGATVKVAILTGSLTAANSLERIAGFQHAIGNASKKDPDIGGNINIVWLGPYNDEEDAAKALSLASSVLASHPDLHAAFGVYAYDGPAWTKAMEGAGIPPGKICLIEFDVTPDNIPPVKSGYAYATVGQRQYFMGYYGVKLLYNMTKMGVEQALKNFIPGYPNNKIYDTGVDLVSTRTFEFTAPTGEKVKVTSIDDYRNLCVQLGVDPKLLLGE
ncbi:monosaccharide ABC transporter substrate-binding protein, CUT2 family [Ignisphaera aggregans DSM 17230]|uniref:Monosaccharide ABC transporter substrate-binding protein, CUT2 family n=1 Tax=Ignisphaera aggregans (strain DSM 17230 / JCM 13409 / AQ1.S1) TaxID=583356 RepID=E0STS7_IGNAA|nr:monosaccharide ABC transporter substrate-binding protein, CUT2 family [Ignisphaera aggregans DSM 17230]